MVPWPPTPHKQHGRYVDIFHESASYSVARWRRSAQYWAHWPQPMHMRGIDERTARLVGRPRAGQPNVTQTPQAVQ